MGSNPDPGGVIDQSPVSFDEFQRQASLMTSCTLLWKELTDHFTSLENDIQRKSEAIKRKIGNLDAQTKDSLDFLEKRETTIDSSISVLLEKMKERTEAAITSLGTECEEFDGIDAVGGEVDDGEGLLLNLSSYCSRMNSKGFWGFVTHRKKELESVRAHMPAALADCVDPARFALEAISEVFPVDKRKDKCERVNDLGWACVLILESLIPLVVDPILGKSRLLVTPSIKERAKDIAETWKKSLDERGGIENVKTPDVHTFLQHLVTFGIFKKEDLDLYKKLVIGSAWRKQMPKLAVSLGLGDQMPEMIEELIGRGQHVDAVHFSYEVGLVHKFPPVPLLKAFLKDARRTAGSILEDLNSSGRASPQSNASKKEQSALRAVIKCIEEYKLEAEFPPENLKKRLEQLEKAAKTEKKRPAAVPANKRTRAYNGGGGPMPPAKAGRSTNAYVSSFPTTAFPAFMKSPSPPTHYGNAGPYPVSPYGNRSPPTSSPYGAYPYGSPNSPEATLPHLIGSYPVAAAPPPMNYSPYAMAPPPQYQPAYYR